MSKSPSQSSDQEVPKTKRLDAMLSVIEKTLFRKYGADVRQTVFNSRWSCVNNEDQITWAAGKATHIRGEPIESVRRAIRAYDQPSHWSLSGFHMVWGGVYRFFSDIEKRRALLLYADAKELLIEVEKKEKQERHRTASISDDQVIDPIFNPLQTWITQTALPSVSRFSELKSMLLEIQRIMNEGVSPAEVADAQCYSKKWLEEAAKKFKMYQAEQLEIYRRLGPTEKEIVDKKMAEYERARQSYMAEFQKGLVKMGRLKAEEVSPAAPLAVLPVLVLQDSKAKTVPHEEKKSSVLQSPQVCTIASPIGPPRGSSPQAALLLQAASRVPTRVEHRPFYYSIWLYFTQRKSPTAASRDRGQSGSSLLLMSAARGKSSLPRKRGGEVELQARSLLSH